MSRLNREAQERALVDKMNELYQASRPVEDAFIKIMMSEDLYKLEDSNRTIYSPENDPYLAFLRET
jgi:hypothetical protein